MRRLLFFFIIILGNFLPLIAGKQIDKLCSNNFCLQIEDFKGAYQYAQGLRYKIGMISQIDDCTEWHYLDFGVIEGKRCTSADFHVENITKKTYHRQIDSLIIDLKHHYLPLQVQIIYSAYDQTGVISSSVSLKNLSTTYPIRISQVPSINLGFPTGDYEYSYLTSGWANERKLHTGGIQNDTIYLQSVSGRSSTDYSPWLSIHEKERDIFYNIQFAWSGNWFLKIIGAETISAIFGEYFDNNELTLLPKEKVTLPEAVVSGAYRSMDNAANNLHRYQRDYLLNIQKNNDPMLVQFNTWFPFQIQITEKDLKPYIDTAADLGIEVFTIDAGWFVQDSYEQEVGNWRTNLKKFPNGLEGIFNYIRKKGLKVGLWFEIESLGEGSDILQQHPNWCLMADGEPIICDPWSRRRHLDFSKPEVFEWALEQFDKIFTECGGIDWVKLDYNISIGSHFHNSEGIAQGNCLRKHILAFYKWLDCLSVKYPNLILENCSSGALRMDIGILKHTHTSFVSDETSVNPSLGMAWSSTLEYTPRMINHWTVGMDNHLPVIDESLSKGYWDYMFRVPMNGQFGISSRITEWSPELKACAKENIALYKTIRTIIADADCYHLTPQPDYKDPVGWTVLAYLSKNAHSAVIMANRGRGGEPTFSIKLPQLNRNVSYEMIIDGKKQGVYKGEKLASEGITLQLDHYRASVVSFQEK